MDPQAKGSSFQKLAWQNIKYQQLICVVAILLFSIKLFAWYLTQSVAILTDALESTVNVISSFIGLYSLYVAARPRDEDHPYGHGKVEFISASIEGILIVLAGIYIIYEAIYNLWYPHDIGKLDYGIILIAVAGAINFIVGYSAVKKGRKNNSQALIASGKHLQSDTYSTIGLVVGLLLIIISGKLWLDSLVALVFAGIIIYTGYRIVRTSLAGIMDERDNDLLKEIVAFLDENRSENWIDIHNLRIIKFGSVLHLDCHLTVPWYFNVHEAHHEINQLEELIKQRYGRVVELFVHTDGCMDFSCRLCGKANCKERKYAFEKSIPWDISNIASNQRHHL